MKKKLLSLLLLVSMVMTAIPFFAFGIGAEDDIPEEYNYDKLYVSSGLTSLFTAYDLQEDDALDALVDAQGNAYATGKINADKDASIYAINGGLYIGQNATLVAKDVIPEAGETDSPFTYQVVFSLKNDEPADKTLSSAPQYSWEGAYVARPIFTLGPLSVQAELIPEDTAKDIWETSTSGDISDYQFTGGIARSFLQFYGAWYSDYDRTNRLPRLLTFDYDEYSSLTFAGTTLKTTRVLEGQGENGSDKIIIRHSGKLSYILRNDDQVFVNTDHVAAFNDFAGDASDIAIGADSPIVLYAVRAYTRELSAEEVKQNHFADIASVFRLDLSYFDFLSAVGKSSVYNAFADIAIDDLSATVAQDMLDKTIETLPEHHRNDYSSIYVKDGLLASLSFAGVSETDECNVTEFYDDNVNKIAEFVKFDEALKDPCSWQYGDGFLKTGLNGTLDMSHLLDGVSDYTVQITMAHNSTTEDDLIYTGVRPLIDSARNSKNRVSVLYIGPLSYAYRFDAKTVATDGVGLGALRFWNATSEAYSSVVMYSDGEMNFGDFSGYQGTVLKSPLYVPFDFSFTHTGANNTMSIYRESSFVQSKQMPYIADAKYPNSIILGAGVNMNIYAVRAYNRVLTEAEFQQNHFGDLATQLNLSLAVFNKMNDTQKATIYAAYANTPLSDATSGTLKKEDVEKKIAEVYLSENSANFARDLLSFKGFQVATNDETAIRSLFAADASLLKFVQMTGAKVDVGVLYAPATVAKNDMTVAIGTDGAVAPAKADITLVEALSKDAVKDGVVYTSSSVLRFASAITLEDYAQEYNFRAYVVLTDASGQSYVSYCDTPNGIFGTSVSGHELAYYFYGLGYRSAGITAMAAQ